MQLIVMIIGEGSMNYGLHFQVHPYINTVHKHFIFMQTESVKKICVTSSEKN